MTELDQWEPDGEPIHPYDLHDLLTNTVLPWMIVFVRSNPPAKDEADYMRNRRKVGDIVEIGGKRYFQTTSIPYRSTSFKELPPPRETADNTPACPV